MTIAHLAVMAIVLLLAALWLTYPLWAHGKVAVLRRRRANVVAYRSRVAEIEADLAAGALDAEAAQQLRDEAGARLLRDADRDEGEVSASPRRPWWALAIVLLVVAASALAFWQTADWRTRELIALAERDPQAAEQQMLADMVVQLRERVADHPADAESWAVLGRSLQLQQRYAEADAAYREALARAPTPVPADWLVGAGEARALIAEDRGLAPVRALFEQALASESGHPKALWYAGLAAIQAGDAAAAFAHWSQLRQQSLPDEVSAVLDAQLPRLAAAAGQDWAPPTAVTLTVNVRIDAALRAAMRPGMTLLVFAKAAEGPPMPLAVRRIDAPQLPLTVTLDDSLAMLPAMKLSGFEQWIVTARLTTGTGAQALSGDLEGRHAVSRAQAAAPIDLVIDQRLP